MKKHLEEDMAYCDKCGAYIPDGQTKCLACGYDEAEVKAKKEKKSSGTAYAYQDELKAKLEEQRRKQQEENRRWAEEMRARHKEEQERQAAKEAEETSYDYGYDYSQPASKRESENRVLAALSYLSILFVLPFIFCPEDEFARFHAKQGFALFVFGLIADAIGSMFSIGWIVTLFRLYCIYKGMTSANEGRKEELPYIGRFFNR